MSLISRCDQFSSFCELNKDPKHALILYETILQTHLHSTAARYGQAKALDRLSELQRSNSMLKRAIDVYRKLIEGDGDQLNDTVLKEAAERCIERMRFIGRK